MHLIKPIKRTDLTLLLIVVIAVSTYASSEMQSNKKYDGLTKQDYAVMQKDYVDYDPESRGDVKFTEWARIDIGDPETELIWLKATNGWSTIYQRKDGTFENIGALGSIDKVLAGSTYGMGVLCIGHPITNDGDSWWYDCHAFSDGAELWVFFKAVDFEEITSCMINGNLITVEQGQAYEAVLPEMVEVAPVFHPIDEAEEGCASK